MERWGIADGGGSVRRRRRRRNVHEFFSFYCTFSIILRNSGKEAGRCAELLICEQFKAWEFCFVFILWNGNIKPRRQLAGTNVLILSLQELGSTGVGAGGSHDCRAPTVKVQHAVCVFVSILHQLIDLVLCDGFAGAADDEGELLSVDVAVAVPARKNKQNTRHIAHQLDQRTN